MSAREDRAYQTEAVEAVVQAWDSGVQRPALVLATGLGKTVIMSDIVADCVTLGDCRPVILVHRDELVRQTVDKMLPHALARKFTVGVVQADQHEIDADVVVASVQTLTRRVRLPAQSKKAVSPLRFDTIVTDECHHAAAESYLRIYDHFGGREFGDRAGKARMLGVTATLARGDGVPLGHVWEKVVFERDIIFGIENGYLVRPRSFQAVLDDVDFDTVKSHHGDWSDADLGAKMMRSGSRIGAAILQRGLRSDGTLRRGITFAPTIACAEGWCVDFNRMGIRSKVVIGDTKHDLRQEIYAATHEGNLDMIVSVMCLTEGFDLPAVELAVIGRPTKKLPLYIQMVGRVLRPSHATGKEDAVLLDVCGLMGHKMPVCLADLDIPLPCECEGCDCTWRYLCMGHCKCPNVETSDGGYVVDHTDECSHGCRVGGEPPAPAEEKPPNDDEIELREVDPFAETKLAIEKKRTKWLVTNGTPEVPFLPGNDGSNPLTVFLWPQEGNLWQIGSFGKKGKPARHGEPMEFPTAVLTGLALYGTKPRPLVGSASDAQRQFLINFGHDDQFLCSLTKQQAADLLSVELTTRRLGLAG